MYTGVKDCETISGSDNCGQERGSAENIHGYLVFLAGHFVRQASVAEVARTSPWQE